MECLESYGKLFSVLWEQNKYLEMEVILRDILRIDSGNFNANLYLGIIAKDRGKFQEALNHLKRALELEPAHEECRKYLGEILVGTGSDNEAIELYKTGVKLNAKNPEFYCGMGVAYHNKRDYMKAYNAFRHALDIDPNHRSIMKILSTLTALGRYAEAEQLQDEARARGHILADGLYGTQMREGLTDPMDRATHHDQSESEQRKWFKTDKINFFPYDDLSRQGELEEIMESCILNDTYLPPERIFNNDSDLISFGDCFSGHLTGYIQYQKKRPGPLASLPALIIPMHYTLL